MTNTVNPTIMLQLLLVVSALFHGCAGGLFSGGYEPYLDANGEVVKAYPADYDQTIRAGIEALATAGISIRIQYGDSIETTVQARTPGGAPLRLRFTPEGHNLTVVRVRTGVLGYWDREYSYQLHVYLSARLETGKNTPLNPPETFAPDSAFPEHAAEPAPPTAEISAPPVKPHRNLTMPPNVDSNTDPSSNPSMTPEIASPPPEPSGAPDPLTADREPPPAPAVSTDSMLPRPDYILFFEKDSNIPPPSAMEVLDQAAARILANPDTIIAISGYADSEEDPDETHLVSESRTLAVKSFLIGKGTGASRILTDWHGSRFSSASHEDQSQYRRVEIRLIRGL